MKGTLDNEIKYFTDIATASKKMIILNLDPCRCIVFGFVTKEDAIEALASANEKFYKEIWRKTLFSEVVENGRTILQGFASRAISGGRTAFMHLSLGFVQKITKLEMSTADSIRYTQSLSLEEQSHLLSANTPYTREDVNFALRTPKRLFGPDYEQMLKDSPDVQTFVDDLANLLDLPKKDQNNLRIFESLRTLWQAGLMIFSPRLFDWKVNGKWQLLFKANPRITNTLRQLYSTGNTSGHYDNRLNRIISFFAASTTIDRADISPAAVDKYTSTLEGIFLQNNSDPDYEMRVLSDIHKLKLSLLAGYNSENPNAKVKLSTRRIFKQKTVAARDINFGWVQDTYPHLTEWQHYFHLYISSLKNARLTAKLATLNNFLDFLGTLDNPPTKPWLVTRQEHITDVTLRNTKTFFTFALAVYSGNGKRIKSSLSTLRSFFIWLSDYLIAAGMVAESQFTIPIHETDSIGSFTSIMKTPREALPPYVIMEMKAALIENDFAIPKTFSRATVPTIEQATGYSTRVFYPGPAICLYSLLDTPIRSHQARWLDSGDLDEYIYNHELKVNEHNPSKYLIVDRKEGVLQITKDGLRSESWLSMWVNTNKTGNFESGSDGYRIPYVSPTLEQLIAVQKIWSAQYLPPITAPLKYRDYMQDVREYRPEVKKGPEVCPLFRDPTNVEQLMPITYPKLARAYTQLLEVVEKRIFEKYAHKIQLVKTDEKGKKTWAVDLHSLRVSGITNLIEAGVPVEVVQQYMVGHKVIIMTLHYLKHSPAKLREFIIQANENMISDQNFVGSKAFIDALNEFTPFLLSQNGPGLGPGVEALSIGDGIIVLNSDGICPGTSCSTGFLLVDRQNPVYGPVPGGKRCGLCRYWITGPAHLLGQITAVNNLAYLIRKKGLEVAKLNELKMDAEDADNKRAARVLRDRIDLLNRELELDVAEWVARYQLAEQSIEKLADYIIARDKIIATDATPNVPLFTSSSNMELKVTLEHAHQFALLDQITQLSSFNPGFTNAQAELEKQQVLSKMMIANGIEPFLLTLSAEHAQEAGNLLSAMILQQVSTNDLDDVLDGKKRLENYPNLSAAIVKLEESASTDLGVSTGALSKISELLAHDRQALNSRSGLEEQPGDEELFG